MKDTAWTDHPTVDVEGINADLVNGTPTVDVAIYYPSNLDPAHHAKVNVDLLVDGFRSAKEVFGAADVQLRLLFVKTGHLDPSLFSIHSTRPGSGSPSSRYVNMYIQAERRPSVVSDETLAAFRATVGETPNGDRIVHILALQEVFIEWHDPIVEHRVFQAQTIETSGLSFPGYMHGDGIPREFRGAITITNLRRNENSWQTIAHELGHKLLNVSHEYGEISPQHEVNAEGGLMLYGSGTDIPSGPEGRFHYERLHRSPFIYVESDDGVRKYNPDYAGAGFYYDDIYKGVSVEFDPE